jgi:hypothetical protein
MIGMLMQHFFMLMFAGIIMGTVSEWNSGMYFLMFLLLAVLGLWLNMYLLAVGGHPGTNPIEIMIGVIGFTFGHMGGSSAFRNTFGD